MFVVIFEQLLSNTVTESGMLLMLKSGILQDIRNGQRGTTVANLFLFTMV